jgi:DNA-binding helix-hairpin-helix protein with protein kinase domain
MNNAVVQRGRLGPLGVKLGAGGQARVFAVPSFTLPDAPGPLVFKEYKTESVPPHGLRSLVGVRNRLEPEGRSKLDALACWPLRIVEDAGTVRGVLMSLIPESFIQERRRLGTGTRARDPREVQNLIVDPTVARRVGMPCPTPAQRLVLCRDFAAAVHLVHRLGLVIGDINARNALYQLTGRPGIMLVDCDSIRIRGSASVVQQLNAPDWEPPESRPGRSELTQATDRYKLGLIVLRCLGPGSMASVGRDPSRVDSVLDAEGRSLLRAALGTEPTPRPTAQDWGRYLQWRITGRRPATVPPAAEAAYRAAPAPTGGLRRDASGVWRRVT